MPNARTPQESHWLGKHGQTYSRGWVLEPEALDNIWRTRVTGGVARSEIVKSMLDGVVPKDASILEVGCNDGNQLVMLQGMGYTNLTGLELIPQAVATATKRVRGTIVQGSAFELPFEDNAFDLVYTCWVLSHIAPGDVEKAASEIYRVAKRWIFITENHAEKERCTIPEYLWQRDHRTLFPGNILKVKDCPPAKPHPAAPSSRVGYTSAFILEKASA